MSDTISILGYNVFTGTSTLVSDKVGVDAYFGADDGLHTLMIDLDSFIGSIKIQASIVKTPTDDDWFNAEIAGTTFAVDTTGKVGTSVAINLDYTSAETSIKTYNTVGNFVWIRASISNWTAGIIKRIEINR